MKNKSIFALIVIGFAMTGAGLWYVKTVVAADGVMSVLPYIGIGLGCGAFGHGMGELFSKITMKNSQELAKQIAIEKKDERNIQIANRAKSKAYDAMIYIFGALMLSFALMNINFHALLILVFAYLIVVGISVYYHCRYAKEM